MPSSVQSLLDNSDLSLTGNCKWGESPKSRRSGVYLVSLSPSAYTNEGILGQAPVSTENVKAWITRVPEIELDGKTMKSPEPIIARLSGFWLPDESILYIGMTMQPLSKRIGQYYRTDLGKRAPHAGGHWTKTLSILDELVVYYADCDNPDEVEDDLIETFIEHVSEESKSNLHDPRRPFPFANLAYPKGNIKAHGLGKTVKR